MWKLIAIVAIDLLMLPVVLTQSPTYFHIPFLAAQPSPAKSAVTITQVNPQPVHRIGNAQKRRVVAPQVAISRAAARSSIHPAKHLPHDSASLWNRLISH